MKKRSILFVVVGSFMNSIAMAGEADIAVREHMSCVSRAASKVDDGIKTTEELAKLVVPVCHAEHEAAMQASMPDRWSSMSSTDSKDMELAHTIAAVERYKSVKGQ